MPRFVSSARFRRDIAKPTRAQRRQFYDSLAILISDLQEMEAGRRHEFRRDLLKKLHGESNLFEFRWADDGRTTFKFGDEQRAGLRHVEWIRCGTHDILP